MRFIVQTASLGLLLLLLAPGCARFEPARVRREQTESFTTNLAVLAGNVLSKPLSLNDCVLIAMSNNYEVRQADLNRELARIGKNVAFTAFLPSVTASAGYNYYARDPETTDKAFGVAGVDICMPIFMPSTWFLYAAARHGFASSEIAAHYVRQAIVLQTTINYFNMVIQQETIGALESQAKAALEAAERIEGLADEGFFAAWERDEAFFIADERDTALNRARRRLAVVRGELLTGMGLSPGADLRISGETGSDEMPDGSIGDLVLMALEIHPELSIADRQVVIMENQVRQAFCEFLPAISLFSSGAWTGNELAAHSLNWVSGFKAAWTVFDGFANVARYRAAKVERRQSELERESTFLSIMVRVIAAEAAARDAAETAVIRQRAYDIAAAKYADYEARAREGIKPLSDALDALALMDLAQVALISSRYQERIAVASLKLAMGITLIPLQENQTKEGN